MASPSQTFQDHIQELRGRLFLVALAVIVSACIAYVARNAVIEFLQRPLDAPLFYSSPGGGFNFVVKLSMIIGMFVALPVLIYQLIRFLQPALPFHVKRRAIFAIMGASGLLAAAGVTFAYIYIIPQSLQFFGEFSTNEIKPLISADSYLSFMINSLLIFAIAFQIPLIVLFINRIKPLKPRKLLHYQRHVVVGAFAIALILPFNVDPVSQTMVAMPIIVLYYLSVILVVIANHRRSKKLAVNEEVTAVRPAEPAPASELTIIPVNMPPAVSQRLTLSMDGMRRAKPQLQPAAARVAPQPALQQTISRPRTVKRSGQPATSPRKQPLSIDGFFRTATSS